MPYVCRYTLITHLFEFLASKILIYVFLETVLFLTPEGTFHTILRYCSYSIYLVVLTLMVVFLFRLILKIYDHCDRLTIIQILFSNEGVFDDTSGREIISFFR